MPRGRKSQRAKRRARQEVEIHLGVLPIKRGGTLDVTPHVASWNIATDGGYLMLGEGFTIIEEDERASYMDKVREYREVGGENWHGSWDNLEHLNERKITQS